MAEVERPHPPGTSGDNEREALVAELRALRTRRGLTYGRLEQSPLLLDLLGGSVQTAHASFLAAVNRLGNDLHAVALRHAYGIDGVASTLSQRRSDFAHNVADHVHVDTVENWENKMVEELATQLLADRGIEEVTIKPSDSFEEETVLISLKRSNPFVDSAMSFETWKRESGEVVRRHSTYDVARRVTLTTNRYLWTRQRPTPYELTFLIDVGRHNIGWMSVFKHDSLAALSVGDGELVTDASITPDEKATVTVQRPEAGAYYQVVWQ